MSNDTNLEAATHTVLSDPVAYAAYERAKTERRRRAALKTFCRAMKRYEKRANKLGLDEQAMWHSARVGTLATVTERAFGHPIDIDLQARSARSWLVDVHKFYGHGPSDSARRSAWLWTRAADALAKLRAALAAES